MQFMLIFKETTAEVGRRDDPAAAPAYWGAWQAYVGAMYGAGIVQSGNGLQAPRTGTTVRNSDEPKAALIERFRLSDRQAEDILEIRLRQLARLEAIKIEQELKALREEQSKLEDIVNNPAC